MNSAIAGLIGAGIGALAGIAGAFISQLMQARATQERALQSKKEEAYSNTLRYLLRVRNRRSGMAPEEGTAFITKESAKDFLDDMVEAQFWTSALTIYCAVNQKAAIVEVSRNLNDFVADFVVGKGLQDSARMEEPRTRPLPLAKFDDWYETILACAREDIGESYAG